MKPGALVTVHGLYPGVVMRSAPVPGRAMVVYQMPGGVKVRAAVALADVTERKKIVYGAGQVLAA